MRISLVEITLILVLLVLAWAKLDGWG